MAQFHVPTGQRKVAFDGRRLDVHGGLYIGAVERIVADGRDAAPGACEVGVLADGVGGGAYRGLGNHIPAACREWYGKVRIEVEAAHVAGVEAGLRAV